MLKKIKLTNSECAVIKTPFSKVALTFESGILVKLDFSSQRKLLAAQSEAAKLACQQIEDFCSKKLPCLEFQVEMKLEGTAFQKQVWQALRKIPAGQVLTYGDLAQQLKTSARAVGNACRANPVPLFVPCHRIVSKSGLGGYVGRRDGVPMKIKAWLLSHEGVNI